MQHIIAQTKKLDYVTGGDNKVTSDGLEIDFPQISDWKEE